MFAFAVACPNAEVPAAYPLLSSAVSLELFAISGGFV